jgi:hypothetical protein
MHSALQVERGYGKLCATELFVGQPLEDGLVEAVFPTRWILHLESVIGDLRPKLKVVPDQDRMLDRRYEGSQ